MESCEGCGFEWDALSRASVTPRLTELVGGFAALLRTTGDAASLHARPEPERWSVVEYGSHVREVAASLLTRFWDRLPAGVEQRSLFYNAVFGERSLGWVAAQTVHEAGHHLGDAQENLRRLASER